MKPSISALHRLVVALLIGCCLSVPAASQTPKAPGAVEARTADVLAAAREIMRVSRYCAAITVDESGRPQARTIDPFPPEDGMVVWFATNPKSRKVAQLRRDPRITLYYFDPRSPELGYATLLGRARLVNDPAEKEKRWKKEWEGLWPDRDASYLLVEVTPERLEVSSEKQRIANDPVTWAPASIDFPIR
ncbi:MAG TPA: pyridoxamine 5'-phosphate oxidase family protein [Vicinamibacterales bacterium]|nr:pyridoxamine 5'-phosphate oxidase family protein [Vicinamibacterales bacterium]